MVVNPLTIGAIGAGLLFLLGGKKQTGGVGNLSGLTPEEFKAASRAQGERDRLARLARQGKLSPAALRVLSMQEEGAEDELPDAVEPWRSAGELTPWSSDWLLFWNRTMRVAVPVPQQVLDQFDRGLTNPTVFYSLGPEQYLRNFVQGLVAGPKGVPLNQAGEPKKWAGSWLAACELVGPSPTVGGTRHTWGPYYGMTAKGAKRAESLAFRPRTWPWHVNPGRPEALAQVLNGEVAKEFKGGKAGFAIGEAVAQLIPYVGSIVATALSAAKSGSGYGRDIPDLSATDDPNGMLNMYGIGFLEARGGWRPTPKDDAIGAIEDNVLEEVEKGKYYIEANNGEG